MNSDKKELYNYRAYIGLKSWQKIGIAFALFIAIALSLPIKVDTSTIFSASSLLFSIILGFFLAGALANFARLKTLVAQETGTLTALYNFLIIINPELALKAREMIDQYIITRFDWELENYVENTGKEFSNIFELLKSEELEAKDNRKSQALYFVFSAVPTLAQFRQEISIVAKSTLNRLYWLLLYVLGTVVILSVFLSVEKDLAGRVTSVLLSTAVIIALIILDEVDKNKLNEQDLAFGPYNRVLEEIGKSLYYLEVDVKAGRVTPPPDKIYRLGIYKDFPYSFEKEIKVIRPEYKGDAKPGS